MTVHFSITPDASTFARMVCQDVPSLVVTDGSAAVWVSPGEGAYGAWEAARMGATLARAAESFARECERLARASSDAPLVLPRDGGSDGDGPGLPDVGLPR